VTRTLADRAAGFRSRFAKWPASWPFLVKEQGRDVLYATWVIGNDYRNKSALYGAYPAGYLARVMALFDDAGDNVLHAFSGSLPPGAYSRVDLVDRCGVPDLRFHQGDVCDVAAIFVGRRPFSLVIADPPYSAADAVRYETPMVNRRRALAALAGVTAPGAHLVWLDTVWPMHRKDAWVTVGRITLVRSTNHRVRLVTLFERAA
jgi:hypothetical protein